MQRVSNKQKEAQSNLMASRVRHSNVEPAYYFGSSKLHPEAFCAQGVLADVVYHATNLDLTPFNFFRILWKLLLSRK